MPATPVLNVTNLSCVRGENTLFSELTFSLKASECLHVIGPNGCGKSSLLRILCGIFSAESGEINWTNNKDIAFIGHKDGLKNELTAIENLRFYQQLDGVRDEEALDNTLNAMGILHRADVLNQGLSFGQRRRLAFARLLLSQKDIWILDEPFTGIDHAGRELIESHCVTHLQNAGAIIMTHHQSLSNSELNPYRKELIMDAAA